MTLGRLNPSIIFDDNSSTIFPVTDYNSQLEYGNSIKINTNASESIIYERLNTFSSIRTNDDSKIIIGNNPISCSDYLLSVIASSSTLNSV